MARSTNLLCLLVICSSVNQIFATVSWELEIQSNEIGTTYSRSRERNVHCGFLLSLSPDEKNFICQDFYYAQLYAATNPNSMENLSSSQAELKITDDPDNEGEPLHPLTVGVLTDADLVYPVDENFYFACAAKNVRAREPLEEVYLISFSFRSGWFYISFLNEKEPDRLNLEYYMSLSPEHVPLKQEDLELQYVNIRKVLDILENESPKYIEMIKKRDDLSSLTDWKKNLVCASTLSSLVFRELTERLEFSPTRMERSTRKLDYVPKNLLLRGSNRSYNNRWTSNCIPCTGYTDDEDEDTKATDLCLTPSFDDKNSLYLSTAHRDVIYLSKYFINAPVLKNAKEPVSEHTIIKNYNYY